MRKGHSRAGEDETGVLERDEPREEPVTAELDIESLEPTPHRTPRIREDDEDQ